MRTPFSFSRVRAERARLGRIPVQIAVEVFNFIEMVNLPGGVRAKFADGKSVYGE